MADNRERARALVVSWRPEFSTVPLSKLDQLLVDAIAHALDAAFSRGKDGALQKLHAELNKLRWAGADDGWERAISAVREHIAASLPLPTSPEESRGSASIADEATVERVARAITEHLVREGDTYQFARLNADGSLTLDGDFDPKDIAEAALAAIPAPPAPLKDRNI